MIFWSAGRRRYPDRVEGFYREDKPMLRKAIILLLLAGCVTAGSPNAAYGTCAQRMDVRYCGEGN